VLTRVTLLTKFRSDCADMRTKLPLRPTLVLVTAAAVVAAVVVVVDIDDLVRQVKNHQVDREVPGIDIFN
jgi:hypothetical protein